MPKNKLPEINLIVKILFIINLVFCLLYFAVVIADDLPKTLEALEQYEAETLVDDSTTNDQVTSNTVLQQFNLHVQCTN